MENIRKAPQLLFVEDDPTIRQLMCSALRNNSMEVTEAQDGMAALTFFKAHPLKFDLVITDYHMPKMNGKELLSSLKRIAPELPVIMCSGSPHFEIETNKADAFLKKPYIFSQLEQVAMPLLKASIKMSSYLKLEMVEKKLQGELC